MSVETLTFLFTDIEGSTALLQRLGESQYARVLADHHALVRAGLAAHDGEEVDTQGDAFFAVFSSPTACVAAVIEVQRALAARTWPGGEHVRVRMGIYTGEASRTAAAARLTPSARSAAFTSSPASLTGDFRFAGRRSNAPVSSATTSCWVIAS